MDIGYTLYLPFVVVILILEMSMEMSSLQTNQPQEYKIIKNDTW